VLFAGTLGGFPADQLLTAMGYDSTSRTTAGGGVRNIGLVAGSFTLRNAPGSGSRNFHQVVGLDMQFTPEPKSTAALGVGLGLLVILWDRRLP
jgi:hypothetical protein